MAYYRINRDGRELTVHSDMSLAEMSEAYKDELIGECNQYGFLLGVIPELSVTMQDALKRFKRDDLITNHDIGLGKIDWVSIDDLPKYFNGIKRDITLEGNVVETPIEETDMNDPTGLKFGNANNIQFTVEDGVTRLMYDAGGRRHSVIRGNGEYSSTSIPLDAIETLAEVKGVNFKDSSYTKAQAVAAIKEAVAHVALNGIGTFGMNAAVELIIESIPCSEWSRINWKRIIRQHSDLTVQEFIDAMNGKVEYLQGYNIVLNVTQTLTVTMLVEALEHWLETRAPTAHEVYQATVNPNATVEEFLTAIAPLSDEGNPLNEDPAPAVDAIKELRKRLLGSLDRVCERAYRETFKGVAFNERRLRAIYKQFQTIRTYVKGQLKDNVRDGDTIDNFHVDMATFGSFRVLRIGKEGQDWGMVLSVQFKDHNWVITE